NFEAAIYVFEDPLAATQEDVYELEQRWRTIGMVGPVAVLVVHTWPETDPETGEEVGRIISARKATPHERLAYEEGYFCTAP
ncbi:MAG: BrnT family toxin, partial [Chloroflexi bacterium]|nr:BrnT family toxin [Chloroflexota bacterium]